MSPARSDDHRYMFDTTRFHCSTVLRDEWRAFGCESPAEILFLLPDNSRSAYCWKHRGSVVTQAQFEGWRVVESDLLGAAA